MRFFLFFLIWFAILAFGHAYIGARVVSAAQLRGRKKAIAWGVVLFILVIPQIPFFLLINKQEGSWIDAWFWPGFLALGFFSLFLTLMLLRDIVLVSSVGVSKIITLAGKLRRPKADSPRLLDPERRRFLAHSTNVGIAGVAGILTGYGLYESHRPADIEEVVVFIPHLPSEFDGFRIVQFTDIHVGATIKRKFVEGIVEQVHGLRGDLIAFTGDLVDGSVQWLRDEVAPLKELTAPHGKFFVTGNHEYYSGVEPWIEEADRLGFTVLVNEHRLIQRSGKSLVLAGVTDYGGGDFLASHASNPAAAIANAPSDDVKILLAHQPKSVFVAAKAGYDLQLSGHTHGGQFFPWDWMARLIQPYIKGLHKHENTLVYVSRGSGYWGPPLRLGIPPEITVITLKGNSAPESA